MNLARLSPLVKIADFDSSPRRADSPGSSKRFFFVGKATEKTEFIIIKVFLHLIAEVNYAGKIQGYFYRASDSL